MHKKNKKGFTLIEILAVFVVLAILALIAVPTISSVINDSQKSSFKTGMKNIRDAARFYVQRASLDEKAEEDFCVYFSFDNDVPEVVQIEVDGELRTYAPVSHLELKGALPTSGEVKACTDMIELNVCNDHFCGNSTDKEDNVTDGDLSEADTSTPVINQIIVTKKTTSSIEIAVDAYNPNEFGKIATYYYSLDGKNYVESTNNSYAFTDLNYNTEYLIYVKVENKAGKVSEKSVKITTGTFDEISFTVTPKEWSYNKNVVINGETAGATLQYRITKYDSDGNLVATEWATYNGIIYLDTMATIAKPTTIYARFVDGINTSGEKTYVVTTIDTTDPSIISRGVSTTTKSIEIEFVASDSESGIKKTICEYGENYSEQGTVSGNKCIINDVSSNTSYDYRIITTNNAGLTGELKGKATTIDFPEIGITVTPDGWANKKTVVLTGTIEGAKLEYKIRRYNEITLEIEETAFTEYNEPIILDTFANAAYPTTIIAQFNDGVNTSKQKSVLVTSIDTDKPNINITGLQTTTQSITLLYTLSDSTSSVADYTCVYGISQSYGSTGTSTESSCFLSNLDKGKTYYYKITATDIAGNDAVYESSVATGTTNVLFDISQTPSGTAYAKSKKLTINYIVDKVSNPSYYFKATTSATTESEVYDCGSEEVPGACSSNGTTDIVAGTWYHTKSATLITNFTSNGTVYAVINDGDSYLTASTFVIDKIDTTGPSTTAPSATAVSTAPTSQVTITNNQTDAESDIASVKYGMATSAAGTYTYQTSATFTGLTAGTTYYFKTQSTNGVGKTTTSEYTSYTPAKSGSCTVSQDTTSWTTSKTITVTSSNAPAGTTLQYKIGSSGTWTAITSGNTFMLTANNTVYCQLYDGVSTVASGNTTVTKIDATGPTTASPSATAVSAAPTSQVTITNNQTDAESDIASVKYGMATSATGTYTYQTSATFTGLTAGTTYYFKTQSTNGAGTTTTSSYVSYTPGKGSGTCSVSASPSGYATSKTITVSSSNAPAGTTLQYKIGSSGTWTAITSGNTFTLSANNTVYCQLYDGVSTVASNQLSVSTIDTTGPSTIKPSALAVSTAPTSQVKIINNQTDAESDIASVKYGKATSATGTYTYQTSATFTGLTAGTTYYFKTQSTNGAGTTTTSEYTSYTPSKSGSCTVSQNTSSWTINKTITVTSGSAPSGTTLQYKIGSSGTWTAITSGNTFTLTANNTVYCRLYDGVSTVASGNTTVNTIDTTGPTTTAPTVTAVSTAPTSQVTVTCNQTDPESGAKAEQYGIATSATGTYTWQSSATFTGLTAGTTYYFKTTARNAVTQVTASSYTSYTTPAAVNYTVYHYTMNTDMSTYFLAYAESLTSAAGYSVTPSVKTYKGFNSPSTKTVTVAADGSTVVEYKYTRKQITVTFYRNTSSSDTSTASQTFTYGVSGNKFGYNTDGSSKWGTSGQFGAWNRTGYALLGWSTSSTATSKTYSIYSGVADDWINSNAPSIKLYAVWEKDTTPPTCTITGTSTTCAKSRTLTAKCNDSQSGCTSATATKTFTFSSTELTTVTSAAAQSYTITDKAGNSATCTTKGYNVYVDPIAPKAYINGKLSSSGTTYYSLINGSANWTNQNVYMWGRSENSGCAAVSYYQYSTDGTNYTKTTSKPEHTFEKTGTFYIKVTDTLGNTSSASTRAYIDRTAPTATLTVTPDNGDNKFKISVTSTDSQSGIKSTTVTYGKRSSSGACSYASTAYTASGYYWTSNSLSSGTYCFKVTVTDNVGNYITKTTTSSVS